MSNVVTGKVRFSYVHVFEPHTTLSGDEKYSITLLIPKSDIDTYNRIMTEIEKTINENLTSKFGGVRPTNLRLPLYDGDGLRTNGEEFGEECKGNWVITAKSNDAPEIVDAQCNPIISKNEFYSGCYGRASIRFFAFNATGNKGIGCGLGNLQKLEDGQSLNGRTTASEDFGSPVQPTVTQQPVVPQYQAPVQQTVAPEGFQVNPITGAPITPNNTVNNIYGVN